MKKKILVIEDDTDVRENICEILLEENYEVLEAKNGIEGFAHIKNNRPDLVLCDIAMPQLNGIELYKKIQEEIIFNKPFIFLSALSSRENFRKGMKLGVDDYLTKPFNRKDILDAVTTRLNRAQRSGRYD